MRPLDLDELVKLCDDYQRHHSEGISSSDYRKAAVAFAEASIEALPELARRMKRMQGLVQSGGLIISASPHAAMLSNSQDHARDFYAALGIEQPSEGGGDGLS